MTKTAVIYKSKYGATRQYAEMLAEALSADLFESGKIKKEALTKYDTLIFGGGLYAGGISGLSFLKKNLPALKGKRLSVFAVGLSDPKDEKNYQRIYDQNISKEMDGQIPLFLLRGGMDYKTLSPIHKIMMGMLIGMLKKKKESELSEDDRGLLATVGQKISFINQEEILPIIAFARGES